MEPDRQDRDADAASAPVLVVHCDRIMCEFVKEILALEGYVVMTAVWGREALSILRAAPQCLIVLLEPIVLRLEGNQDLEAYMMNPGERARHVVLFMGANANLAELAREFKMDGSLSMPWTFEELFAAVEDAEHMARAKRARPPIN